LAFRLLSIFANSLFANTSFVDLPSRDVTLLRNKKHTTLKNRKEYMVRNRRQFGTEEEQNNCDEEFSLETLTPYKALQYISEKSEDSHLNKEFMDNENVKASLAEIKKVLPFNDWQIIMFAVIAAFSLGKGQIQMDAIGSKLDISPYKLFDMENEIQALIDNGYISTVADRFGGEELSYFVEKDIIKDIREGKTVTPKRQKKVNGCIELIQDISRCTEDQRLTLNKYCFIVMNACRANSGLDIVKEMEAKNLNAMERVLIFTLLDHIITDEEDISYRDLMMPFTDKSNVIYEVKRYLYNEKSKLIRLKYLEIIPSKFAQDDRIHLTDKALKAFMPKDYKKIMPHVGDGEIENCTLIKSKNIYEKQLIYDQRTDDQIRTLSDMLTTDGLSKLQKNLKSEGLRTGVNVLLYGFPGMGKTETVMQVCKKNNRNVLQVNISEMKSMWFGQSEKIIDKVFSQYNELRKSSQHTPVLLFNEADAILSKRRNLSNSSNVGQTENTVQNILLQAFENNEGIIICTTNMIDNLDKAFARRFLYKIEFSKPDKDTRAKLVKLKLGRFLTDDECYRIAASFNLTGGMLDNVLTKIVTKKCLYGMTATFDDIQEYCRQDMMGEREQIKGFLANG
jgi:hypothetical protein